MDDRVRGRPTSVRVALAEDEPDLRDALVQLLELQGHEVVVEASNGADLVNRCVAEQVDIVLVDLDMPVMDGLAAAEEVSEKGLPVVLISGHPDAAHIVLEHEPLAASISKPVSAEALQAAIQHALMPHAR